MYTKVRFYIALTLCICFTEVSATDNTCLDSLLNIKMSNLQNHSLVDHFDNITVANLDAYFNKRKLYLKELIEKENKIYFLANKSKYPLFLFFRSNYSETQLCQIEKLFKKYGMVNGTQLDKNAQDKFNIIFTKMNTSDIYKKGASDWLKAIGEKVHNSSYEFINIESKVCHDFASKRENMSLSHENMACINTANRGLHVAQYSVGISFMMNNKEAQAEKYLLLAAKSNHLPAYLALGHIYSDKSFDKSLEWYKKYYSQNSDEYDRGVASSSIAELYSKNGNIKNYKHWLNICYETSYKNKCKK